MEYHCPILFQQDYIGMVVADNGLAAVALPFQDDLNIQGTAAFFTFYMYLVLVYILLNFRNILRICLGNDAHLKLGFSCHYSCGSSSLQTFQSAGVGNYDAFDIFDYVAADIELAALRETAQHISGLCCGISHSHRFGAAHGGQKFLLQDRYIIFVLSVASVHNVLLCS